MANFLTPRNITIGVASVGGLLLFSQSRTAQKIDPVRNPLNTQGVQNINDRFSKAGGTETGTPAVASPLNSAEKQGTPQTYENNIASGKSASNSKSSSSGSESGTPGKEQVHEGAPGANANAQDKKGKTGREQSHGNLRDIKPGSVG